MVDRPDVGVSAVQFFPARLTLDTLEAAARGCRGCPLFRNATQTVFGRGPRNALVLLVGEQPGNEEDLSGEPFVGPAGRVLDDALSSAGIDRSDAYVTNGVKHFKWVPRGKRRIHRSRAPARSPPALRGWRKVIEVIQPKVLVTLAATFALATVHPSSVLRQPTPEERREMERLITDLRLVARLLGDAET
jgi:DNA polymerase